MSTQGMLSIAEAIEQDRWIQEYNGTKMIEFIQEPQVSIEENVPQFMNWSDLSEEEKASGRYKMPEEELERLSEIVAAGKEYWAAVMAGAVEMMSGDGMLSDPDKQPDDKLIALAQQQAETNKAQADANLALANAQTSKDVAKDLEGEGRKKPVKIENLRGKNQGGKWQKVRTGGVSMRKTLTGRPKRDMMRV